MEVRTNMNRNNPKFVRVGVGGIKKAKRNLVCWIYGCKSRISKGADYYEKVPAEFDPDHPPYRVAYCMRDAKEMGYTQDGCTGEYIR